MMACPKRTATRVSRPARGRQGRRFTALACAAAAGCSPAAPTDPAPIDPAPSAGADVPAPLFTDVTRASGLDFTLTSGRDPVEQILEVKSGGIGLFDWQGNGDYDVFVPNGASLAAPDAGPGARLFENVGELAFRDASERAGLTFRRWGMGVAVGDCNGDGSDDLFVACFGRDALLLQQDAQLIEAGPASGLRSEAWSTSAAFGDLDLDGDLDLYVTNYLIFDPKAPPAPMDFLGVQVFGGPVGLPAAADVLYENHGDGTFQDVSAATGVASVTPSLALGAVILDLDDDGLQDIFVGNDSMPNFLFRSEPTGGAARLGRMTFRDAGSASGIASNGDGASQATMGIAIADVDGDARPDVFTTNFIADTNTLHVGVEGGRFRDATQPYGLGLVSRPYLGWAAGFYDFDLDADEDLLLFNGHVYSGPVCASLGHDRAQPPLYFEREGRRFRRAAPSAAWLTDSHVDRGAAFGDLDRDGDVDCVVAGLNAPLRLLRNETVPGPRWLSVGLSDERPGQANRRGYGARVTLTAGGQVQRRWIYSGGSYQSASAPEAFFGLPSEAAGAADAAGSLALTVRWADGTETEARASAGDHRIVRRR